MAKKTQFLPLNGNLADFAPFELLAHMRTVPGVIIIDKFGAVVNIDTGFQNKQIWTLGDLADRYEPADNLITTVVSDNVGDFVLLEVSGLVEVGGVWKLINQEVTLDGQTPVALTTPLIRAYRVINKNSVSLLGAVYVYDGSAAPGGIPTDLTKVGAHIYTPAHVSHNQTLMTQFTIPDGYWGFINIANAYFANKQAAAAVVAFRVRRYLGPFRTQRIVALNTQGSGAITLGKQDFVGPILPRSDMHAAVLDCSANDVDIALDYQLILMELPG